MTWELDVEHIGGLEAAAATIQPGPNALRASNWQGKSSFVEAVKVALGVSTTLTEGRDRGSVTLETPEATYNVELIRTDSTVTRRGSPYLTDEYDRVRAELFAAIDETNAIRAAVRQGQPLEELLLRPLDFQNLDEQIADTKREREQVEAELAQAKEARKRLPRVADTVSTLESELAELRERRQQLSTDEGRTGEAHSALSQARADRDQARQEIDRLERSIERREQRLSEKREALAGLPTETDAETIRDQYQAARETMDEHKRTVEVLQSVYSATELVLEERRLDLITEVQRDLTGDAVVCWTCGNETDRETIEARLDQLGERLAVLRSELEDYRDEVESLEAKREEIDQTERRRRELSESITTLEESIAEHRDRLDEARDRVADAETRIDTHETDVDESIAAVTDVESEIKYREAELTDARSERESLETRADRVESLQDEKADLDEELERLRSRKDRITRETREAFDDAIGDIVDRFDTGFETARLSADFELVVARDGREAQLDALSEGELELLGFVATLAGYEAFDVADTAPIMLVDGVGGLAEDNLQTLIEYLTDRTQYLLFTVYPEYAPFGGTEIDPAEWTIATESG